MPSPNDVITAKKKLDRLIAIQRVALYKPIQIAEILYKVRIGELRPDDILDLETYRNPSKRWRDVVCQLLVDRVSTSSQKYQDNLFEENAIPPRILSILAKENLEKNGIVEKYIYEKFWERQQRVIRLANILEHANAANFKLELFFSEFKRDKHIKRSIDKAYEIVIFALFSTLVKHLNAKITLSTDPKRLELLRSFEDFSKIVLGIDSTTPTVTFDAKIFRAGVTNSADRGLDMWTNFGPAIQVKHLTLTLDLAEEVCENITADDIVIVCDDSERVTITRILTQLGQRIRGIIVKSQLISWYELALRGEYAKLLSDDLISNLKREFKSEFPYSISFKEFYDKRGYSSIPADPDRIWVIS